MEKQRVVRVYDVVGFTPAGAKGKYVSRLLVDGESVGSKNLVVNHFTLRTGQKTYPGQHPSPYEEVYYVLRGRGILTLGGTKKGERYDLNPDTVAYIPCGVEHQIENKGKKALEIITIMPFHPTPGANTLYDERKREWGTSFRLIDQGLKSKVVGKSAKNKKGVKSI